jgi:hypothetical protein
MMRSASARGRAATDPHTAPASLGPPTAENISDRLQGVAVELFDRPDLATQRVEGPCRWRGRCTTTSTVFADDVLGQRVQLR